jgi:hypothetical protein
MKVKQASISGVLAALLLGAYAWAPVIAATPEQSGQAAGKEQPIAESPAPKGGDVCTRLDANKDGYISESEWKGLDKLQPGKKHESFKSVAKNGQLDLKACEKAAGA